MEKFMSQRIFRHLMFAALVAVFSGHLCVAAAGQSVPAENSAAANAPDKAYLPDPTHIPFILSQNIPWEGRVGHEQHYNVLGDPSKPGPYIQILKWWPGNFSKPHYHTKTRYITVLSGTWWVSSSTHFDPDKTYPLPTGTLTQDVANTVHWDGAKAGGDPVVLEIVGDGPAPNVRVDENGKPIEKTN
jgi:quercetin dioxygenase-like cupin family protein